MIKTEKVTLVENAYHRIKMEIAENRMTPGNPMLEQEIAHTLGMSRTPVREALLRLEAEGLVEIIPRRGVKILPISKEDMQEIYEIFITLESFVAANLSQRNDLSKEDFRELEVATDDMERALQENDLDAWAAADHVFHQKLVEIYGNKRLTYILDMMRNQTHRLRLITRHLRKKPTQSVSDHRQILKAIYEGNSTKANNAVKKHRERTANELLQILEKMHL